MPNPPTDRTNRKSPPDKSNPGIGFNFSFGGKSASSNSSGGPAPTSGVEGILGGLSGLLKALGDLAERGEELKRSGNLTTPDGREVSFQYGVNVRTMNSGRDVRVEPFGNLKRDETTGETTVHPVREPVADILTEDDHVKVLLEMPGIDAAHVAAAVDGDLLTVTAENGPKRYRKELMLPGNTTYDPAKTTITGHSGIVEIRCRA